MAGFNSKNLISAQGTFAISSSIPSPVFKVHEGDIKGMMIQINSAADPGALSVESSLDGGASWYTVTSAVVTAHTGTLARHRITEANMVDVGPLMRIKATNAVTALAIWVTVRS